MMLQDNQHPDEERPPVFLTIGSTRVYCIGCKSWQPTEGYCEGDPDICPIGEEDQGRSPTLAEAQEAIDNLASELSALDEHAAGTLSEKDATIATLRQQLTEAQADRERLIQANKTPLRKSYEQASAVSPRRRISMSADTPSAALPEIRVEEIRAINLDLLHGIAARLTYEAAKTPEHTTQPMRLQINALDAARRAIPALLADRDRLLRRVEELEAEAVATNAIRRRVAALLLAIQHDCHWYTQRGGGAIRQFRAYDAEAAAILAELLPLEQRKEIERLLTSESKP